MKKSIHLMVLAYVASIFSACGDDVSSAKDGSVAENSNIKVESLDDLPLCSDKREGSSAFVKDEKAYYICEDGAWVVDVDDADSDFHRGDDETMESKSSSSGKKGNSKSSSSAKEEPNSSAQEQPDVVKVKNKSITGVSQKGPFVTGSVVKLYELDGETYAQTGKSFTGKITSDKGEFSISSVTLASQYALLEASGYFRNEVSGKKSSGTITLNALTDLSEREKVNINLLTHLEYERALYLVGTGMNVPAAKKQAEVEIFNAFGIQGDFENSEDLNIFSKGDGNAALLAFSVLMLGERSEAELTELLSNFATDIEKDGEWNDESTKTKIADWASEQDVNGKLTSIHQNIESWNLGTVPNFEKYVRNFWYREYGLDACGTENKGKIVAAGNEGAKTYGTETRYICNGEVWLEASDVEKDTYQWEVGEDGEIKLGSVTLAYYVYDEALDQWVTADKNAVKLNLGCTTNRTGEIGKSDETYYVCKNSNWQVAAEIDYDTYGEKCTSAEVGKTMNGKENAANKYYCSANGWVSLMGDWNWDVPKEVRLNPKISYGTMTDKRDNKTYKTVEICNKDKSECQIWMAENLNYADSTKTPSLKGKSWCYDNKAKNCEVTGRLYTWAAAIDSVALANDADNPQTCGCGENCTLPTVVQGVCPEGWHLPSYDEWQTLFTAVGGSSKVGTALKSQTGWYSQTGDAADRDASGFSALPAGFRDYYFSYAGYNADFWSASEYDSYDAYIMYLSYVYENVSMLNDDKSRGISVRCLKD